MKYPVDIKRGANWGLLIEGEGQREPEAGAEVSGNGRDSDSTQSLVGLDGVGGTLRRDGGDMESCGGEAVIGSSIPEASISLASLPVRLGDLGASDPGVIHPEAAVALFLNSAPDQEGLPLTRQDSE